MSDTPRTDEALEHQGASHMDAILRLERLIEVSRQLERELAAAKAILSRLPSCGVHVKNDGTISVYHGTVVDEKRYPK